MDFGLSLSISGILVSLMLYIALAVYYRRVHAIYSEITRPTQRSLVLFGVAAAAMGLTGITGLYMAHFVPIWVAVLFSSLLVSQLNLIIESEKTLKRSIAITILLAAGVVIETIARYFVSFTPIMLMIGLSVFIVGTFAASIYLLKESPSPFTGSMLVLVTITVVAWVAATIADLHGNPEYFIVNIAPLIVTTGILASLLRPWRRIISISVALLAFTVGVALGIPAFMAGEIEIVMFAAVVAFAGICVAVPLDYFIEQATITRAKTPIYISLTLVMVALLAITHSSNYAIAYVSGAWVWDPTILFINWVFGIAAVCCFIMAGISVSFSNVARGASRDLLIGIGVALTMLGHPFVMNDRYILESLYLPLVILIAIGFIALSKVSLKLYRMGSGKSAARFVFFMFASLAIALVTMFADQMPIIFTVVMEISAGILLLASNPRALRKVSKG